MDTHLPALSLRDAAIELARCLHAHGTGDGIRALEAIAAAIVNRVDQECTLQPFVPDLTASRYARVVAIARECGHAFDDTVSRQDEFFPVCLRIARRAVSGALPDPTRGATRFHALGVAPDWATGRKPSACVGSMFFYR